MFAGKVHSPICYHATYDPSDDCFSILLEYAEDSIEANHLTSISPEQAVLSVKYLAEFHDFAICSISFVPNYDASLPLPLSPSIPFTNDQRPCIRIIDPALFKAEKHLAFQAKRPVCSYRETHSVKGCCSTGVEKSSDLGQDIKYLKPREISKSCGYFTL